MSDKSFLVFKPALMYFEVDVFLNSDSGDL